MPKKANVNQIISFAINMIGKTTYLIGTEKTTMVKGLIEDIRMVKEKGCEYDKILEKQIEIQYRVRWEGASIGIWCKEEVLSIFRPSNSTGRSNFKKKRGY